MKKAVIYARYSSDNQNEQSIEGQIRVCNEYAEHNDILIVDSYVDRAMTGTNDHRPEFQRMIKDSQKKEWDYVIVYKLDRFSRDKYETVVYRKKLKDNNVKLLSAMENIPDTPEGIILEGLLESMNQYFSAELSQKVKRGMRESRIKGNYTSGNAPYGYKIENKKLTINEHEAALVRYIYERYDSGYYINDILLFLEAKNVKNRDRRFNYFAISRILENEYYTGIYRFGNEVYTNIYPQIIDKDLYERVRVKSKSLQHGGISTITNYIFSRKLVCGYCGNNINGSSGISKNGERKYYYRCNGRKKNSRSCPKTALSKRRFENFVIIKIIGELNKTKVMNILLDRLLDIQNDKTKVNEQIQNLKQEQQQAKTSLKNMMKNIKQGINSQTLINRIKELTEQIETIEKNILTIKNKPQTTFTREQLQNYYSEKLQKNGREIAALLVNKMRLYNDKIEILLNSPINNNFDNSQNSFYVTTIENPFSNKKFVKLLTIEYFI